MHSGDGDRDRLTRRERERIAVLAGTYVAVKLTSAIQASDSARRYNERRGHAFVSPLPDGAIAGMSVRF